MSKHEIKIRIILISQDIGSKNSPAVDSREISYNNSLDVRKMW